MPDWVAVILAVPFPVISAVVPATVRAFGLELEKETGRPEEEVAVSVTTPPLA